MLNEGLITVPDLAVKFIVLLISFVYNERYEEPELQPSSLFLGGCP